MIDGWIRHLAGVQLFASRIANCLDLHCKDQGLPGKRMIADEAGDTIIDCGYEKCHFITVLVGAENTAANLDCFSDRDFMQGDITYQFRITLAGCIVREQTGFYGVAVVCECSACSSRGGMDPAPCR